MTNKKLTIKGLVTTKQADAELDNLIVELFDQQQRISTVIASTNTNNKGEFIFKLNLLKLKRLFLGRLPEVYLTVRNAEHLLFSSMDEIVLSPDKDLADIEIDLPKKKAQLLVPIKNELPKFDIRNLLTKSGVKTNDLPTIEAKLKQAGLLKLESILSNPSLLTTRKTGLDENTLSQFKAITKFAAASGSVSLAEKLTKKGFRTFSQLGAISYETLTSQLGRLKNKEKQQLIIFHQKTNNIRNDVLNLTAVTERQKSRDGSWKQGDIQPQTLADDTSCQCTGCKNVFSPYAYLISLLDMINDHWRLTTDDMEQILLQKVNDLDCDTAYECFLQIELAIEVLEKSSRTQLPLNDVEFTKELETIWVTFLFGSDDVRNIAILREMGNAGSIVSNRLRKLIISLREPDKLETIRKSIAELKKPVKIQDLKNKSPRYSDGGDDFISRLDKVYQAVLLSYRDALIRNTKLTKEKLQKELYINLKAGSCKKTNRLTFLILSLQSFVLAGRTGQVSNNISPKIRSGTGDLQILEVKLKKLASIPIEEASWKWLKDYPSWASAMYAFLYPENSVLPFFDNSLHHKFQEVSKDLLTSQTSSSNDIRRAYAKLIYPYYSKLNYPTYYKFDLIEYAEFITRPDSPDSTQKNRAERFLKEIMGTTSLSNWLIIIHDYLHIMGSEEYGYNHADAHLNELGLSYSLHFPLLASWLLNRSGNYSAAHDWYRQLYDPTKSGVERSVFDFETHFSGNILFDDWEEGILNPEELASHREGVMLRHVILMMVKNLLDWADHEFALATASSIDRARQLYELAQEVLDSPDLHDHCGQSIRELTIAVVTRYGLNPVTKVKSLIDTIDSLYQIDNPVIIRESTKNIDKILHDSDNIEPSPEIEAKIEKIVTKAINEYQTKIKSIELVKRLDIRNTDLETTEDIIIKQSVMMNDGSGDSIFFSNHANSIINIPSQDPNKGNYPYLSPKTFCVPPNPTLVALDAYIKLALLKFQFCLDFTGEPLPSIVVNDESVAEFFDTVNAEAERQPLLNLPNNWFNEPPRYRYSYLIEKARQYTEVAQRMGSALLVAQVNFDNERFGILKAQHAIELASSTIDLRNLGLRDAQIGLDLVDLQSERAEAQLSFWEGRVGAGMLSANEKQGLNLMLVSAGLSIASGAVQGLGAIIAFFGAGAAGTAGGAAAGTVVEPGGGTVAGAAGGGTAGFAVGAAIAAAIPGTGAALSAFAGAVSSFGSHSLTLASFERRFEDWNLQKDLSDFDVKISEINKKSANNRIDMANQELTIAKLQNTQAKEVLTFLENKFSNDHLYEWMIQVLSQNYRTLMQISTNVARLAQRALEFERQQALSIIVGDYWSISSSQAYSGNLSDEQKKSGLLGAERLLTDLTRLDAYKLSTEQRRLQMSKTISMAQVLPSELLTLKAEGKATFNTLMHWFDRDFPGHYLRLIKSVRISILALTPPIDGIHAVLSNSGESTVVVPDGLEFNSIRAFRDFGERIALDSPFNETGLFVFDYNDPMFLPFEGLGVETQWVLELPKASNRFNFDTLVDVMLTIEYTALHSDRHTIDIREALGDKDSNDISLNPRLQYPDEWYHFKNDPLDNKGLLKLNLQFLTEFLPPNYVSKETSSTKHVTIIISGDFADINEDQLFSAIKIEHKYIDKNTPPQEQILQVSFKTKDLNKENQYAFLSTRDSNDISHELSAGISPIGKWNVSIKDALPNNISLGDRITDVLLIVTIEGKVNWG